MNDNKTNTPEQKLSVQAGVYSTVLSTCMSEKNCTAFLTWGIADKYSYILEQDKMEKPLLLDERYQPKPAYRAVLQLLQRQ